MTSKNKRTLDKFILATRLCNRNISRFRMIKLKKQIKWKTQYDRMI